MVAAANDIYASNPNVLISSPASATTPTSPYPDCRFLGGGYTFHKSSFTFVNKIVLELHNYATGTTSCSSLESSLSTDGFDALNNGEANQLPVVMTEFGYLQDSSTYNSVYATCLKSYLSGLQAGWMAWVIAGSYYIRSGTQDFDETWGKPFRH
jgi:hypothetical protein